MLEVKVSTKHSSALASSVGVSLVERMGVRGKSERVREREGGEGDKGGGGQ